MTKLVYNKDPDEEKRILNLVPIQGTTCSVRDTTERNYEEAAKKRVAKIKEALSRALNRRTTC